MVLLAATRWPGLLPPNFSAVYALVFCAGVYFPKKLAWWLPFATLLVTDILLNVFYYHVSVFSAELIGNYLSYAVLILLGRGFGSWTRALKTRSPLGAVLRVLILIGGGLLSAIIFYITSNTFSWFFNPFHNPEYVKTFLGWFTALTKGTSGYAPTWEFFRSTLGSSGLFAGLFAGAMSLMEALNPSEEEEKEEAPEEQPEEAPEEAKA